jgi:hypothetical protein
MDQCKLTQFFQLTADVVAHRQIRFQKSFVTGQQIAVLTGLGIFQCRQQIVRVAYDNEGMLPRRGLFLDFTESPE